MNDADATPGAGDDEAVRDGGEKGGDGDGTTAVERIHARGHEHVTGTHGSTVEVTSDDWLTPAGDCIVGVEADTTPAEFDEAFVSACRSPDATITAEFEAQLDGETVTDTITARGDPELTFDGDCSLVGRTSEYVDDRTVFVGADGAAADLDRELIDALADGAALTLTLTVER
ncbi:MULTISPECIES: DUF371 domain-containing protein [Halolamina]|uniref:DUF371 domain-containing protein n=1 Tax=Halolamina pelagica TaxID=699431 RepID=A0A1I5R917_9EURY|nr:MULTISPECIES: DUF371 domain-containing protein [Halolamina]NHX35745.1 DUF371 domain-containing protein [Halolamina sp. R1-12]SFP54983.1 hypothetical protein SAMN05216277_104299 [Halolamina pelagica]